MVELGSVQSWREWEAGSVVLLVMAALRKH